ncbi:MAG: NAD(P)H-dependent glycerol-3-phosphate dehydrogenase [Desulfovibrio sp.]|uniref:NAD(P)H-dependent glycerol-3-phosphate dehydrogenase n=1 Tax=Desulfovibrio sp. 7SRBS1 TaxID=3378064 RepID=UPI003B40BF3E
MIFSVLGGGSWGTALADLLAHNGHDVRLWLRKQELLDEIEKNRENTWYLPGLTLHEKLRATTDYGVALENTDCAMFVVPSQFFRGVLQEVKPLLPERPAILCANKGIELETMCTMSEVVEQTVGDLNPRYAMLSGPSFAQEVARRMPAAVALGCVHKRLGQDLQDAFSNDYFRVYTNPDFKGVELGGAIKNIIAIAAGIADGLDFGTNARAALITRGLAEMSRLGKAMGANPATFMGLAGMGDLVLTCTGELSRNRQVGLSLGKGRKLPDILSQMKMVAEGVKTTEAVRDLGRKLKVDLPITENVYEVLYNGKDPALAVRELMARDLKDE